MEDPSSIVIADTSVLINFLAVDRMNLIQNVLVFCKGDPKKATAAIGPVEFGEIEEE